MATKHPGEVEVGFGVGLEALATGGSTDVISLSPLYRDLGIPSYWEADGRFFIQILADDQYYADPNRYICKVQDEPTYAESERYAKAIARRWHIERYEFDHYDKDTARRWRRLGPGKPVYRFVHAYALEAVANTHRWTLRRGVEIALPGSASQVEASADRFDVACGTVEEAVEAFHRIANLATGDAWLTEHLAGPRRAMEAARAEARRLAALGQHLDSLSTPSDAISAREEEVLETLKGLHASVVEAIAYASDIHLNKERATGGGEEQRVCLDLAAFSGALGELGASLPA